MWDVAVSNASYFLRLYRMHLARFEIISNYRVWYLLCILGEADRID